MQARHLAGTLAIVAQSAVMVGSLPGRIIEFSKPTTMMGKSQRQTLPGDVWMLRCWLQQLQKLPQNVRLLIYQCRRFIEIDFRSCEPFAFPFPLHNKSSCRSLLAQCKQTCRLAFMQITNTHTHTNTQLERHTSLLHLPIIDWGAAGAGVGETCIQLAKQFHISFSLCQIRAKVKHSCALFIFESISNFQFGIWIFKI